MSGNVRKSKGNMTGIRVFGASTRICPSGTSMGRLANMMANRGMFMIGSSDWGISMRMTPFFIGPKCFHKSRSFLNLQPKGM